MVAVIDRFLKDPDAILDYSLDWSDWLVSGDTILTSVWVVIPAADLIIGDGGNGAPAPSILGVITTVWLIAGAVGVTYLLENTITTTLSRKDQRTVAIVVQER